MATLVKDVVCGMEIDPDTAAATSEYAGTTYYFCAVSCKEDFDAEPEKYLSGGGQANGAKKPWWQFWRS
jgi:YHS domain-containing protein